MEKRDNYEGSFRNRKPQNLKCYVIYPAVVNITIKHLSRYVNSLRIFPRPRIKFLHAYFQQMGR